MKFTSNDDERLRRYLLGMLSAPEQNQVEESLLAEPAWLDRLLMVEEELIDNYVCDQLPPAERAQCESYLLVAPEQREKLRLAQSLQRYAKNHFAEAAAAPALQVKAPISPISGWRKWFSPAWAVPAVALALLMGFSLWQLVNRINSKGMPRLSSPAEAQSVLAALNEAYRAGRYHETRLTGFDYAPWQQLRAASGTEPGYEAREHAEVLARGLVKRDRNAETLQLLGQLYLSQQEWDKAIEQFRAARAISPENARVNSDLGAALLEKAKSLTGQTGSGAQFTAAGEALECLNKALELAPALSEALFNRALCFELLKNPPRAQADWESYLKQDPGSPWSQEAQRHLARLTQQSQVNAPSLENLQTAFEQAIQANDNDEAWRVFSLKRSANGNELSEQLLESYLTHSTQNSAAVAQTALAKLKKAGDLEQQFTGDRYTAELANFYARLTGNKRAQALEARARLRHAHARRAQSVQEAVQFYQQAETLFRQAGDSNESALAKLHIGKNLIWANQPDQASQILLNLDQVAEQRHWLWLRAQANTQLSHAHFARNQFSAALEYAQRAIAFAQMAQDRDAAADGFINVAHLQYFLGDHQSSLGQLEQCIAITNGATLSQQTAWRIYQQTSFNFAALRWYGAALDYQREALQLAEQLRVPVVTARSHTFMGLLYGEMGKTTEGINSIQQALGIARHNAQDAVGQGIMAHSIHRLGNLRRKNKELDQALSCYNEQLALAEQMKMPFYSYGARQGLFLTQVARKDVDAAQAELQKTLALLEQYRAEIAREETKNSFLDHQQEIYETAIQFADQALNNPKLAFDYAEMSRARAALDLMAGTAARPSTYEQTRSDLARQVQLVEYAVLPEQLCIWVIDAEARAGEGKETIKYVRQNISALDLNQKITRYLERLSRQPQPNEEPPTREAAELYELLIQPIKSWLRDDKIVCIVPDQSLCYLPFNTLFSQAKKQYLLEEFTLSLVPSASFLLAEDRATHRSTNSESLLSVGASLTDRSRFPELAPLTGAAAEAQAVARLYSQAQVLTDAAATELAVKRALPQAAVIHLAAHSVPNLGNSPSAAMLLAPEQMPESRQAPPAQDGVWHAYEIQGTPLPRARLVVLSSCQSGLETFSRAEGMLGLARPFFGAGVPLVVASLWRVDSEATSDLMVRFHQYRKRSGLPTIHALRRAQLELLRDGKSGFQHPFYWAAFVAMGGNTKV